jgi:hypothetical protein
VAKALADAAGTPWDEIPEHKSQWIEWRGVSPVGRSIDVNEPFQTDYYDMADAAIRAMSEEVEAAYREGLQEGFSECGVRLSGAALDEDWQRSDARARLKEAGHDDHE